MNRERRSRRRSSNTGGAWKVSAGGEHRGERGGRRRAVRSQYAVSQEQIRADEEAIQVFKTEHKPVCERCGLPIAELSSAVENRRGGNPIHFDCAIGVLAEKESLAAGEKIIYIGQGRFGILYFANVHDMRHFSIRKVIEWEDKDERPVWRGQLADLYSKVR